MPPQRRGESTNHPLEQRLIQHCNSFRLAAEGGVGGRFGFRRKPATIKVASFLRKPAVEADAAPSGEANHVHLVSRLRLGTDRLEAPPRDPP